MLSKRKLIEDLTQQLARINKKMDAKTPMPHHVCARLETQYQVYTSILDNVNEGAYDE